MVSIRSKGPGLSDLMRLSSMPAAQQEGSNETITKIPLKDLYPNKNQCRKKFNDHDLQELATSISEKGLIHPPLVRPGSEGKYQIICGERRWRAALLLGWREMPVFIKSISDEDVQVLALMENVQRKDLTPVEVAKGYSELELKYDLSHNEIGKLFGKSRSEITNYLRILKLGSYATRLLNEEKISFGHAKILASVELEQQNQLAEKILSQGMSVRQLERKLQNLTAPSNQAFKAEFQNQKVILQEKLGVNIDIKIGRKAQLTVTSEYQLNEIVSFLSKQL